GESGREKEKNDRNHADVPASKLDALLRDLVQSTVHVRLAEKQGHAGQDQEQARGKPGSHIRRLHASETDADNECKRDREKTDVDLGDTTNDDRDYKRDDRKYGKVHG